MPPVARDADADDRQETAAKKAKTEDAMGGRHATLAEAVTTTPVAASAANASCAALTTTTTPLGACSNNPVGVVTMRGQLRRDCDCFLQSNYYVGRTAGCPVDRHFAFEEPPTMGRTIGYLLTEGYSLGTSKAIAEIVQAEFDRRSRLDDAHCARRTRNAAQYAHLAWPCTTTASSDGRGPTKADDARVQGTALDDDDATSRAMAMSLHPRLRAALSADKEATSFTPEEASRAWAALGAHELRAGRAYAVPVFTEAFCDVLIERLATFRDAVEDRGRPNSMNSKGVLLDEIPMATERFTNALVRDVVAPLAKRFLNFKDFPLDHHKAFSVEYDETEPDLSLHFDNAEVTLNVHLGGEFSGGGLELRGDKHLSGERVVTYANNRKGFGVLHLGDELHRATPIGMMIPARKQQLDGDAATATTKDDEAASASTCCSTSSTPRASKNSFSRVNLVVWARSTQARVTRGCPMCGSTKYLRRDVLLARGD